MTLVCINRQIFTNGSFTAAQLALALLTIGALTGAVGILNCKWLINSIVQLLFSTLLPWETLDRAKLDMDLVMETGWLALLIAARDLRVLGNILKSVIRFNFC